MSMKEFLAAGTFVLLVWAGFWAVVIYGAVKLAKLAWGDSL